MTFGWKEIAGNESSAESALIFLLLFLAIIPPKLHIILVGLHVVQPAHLATNKADSSGNALYLYSYHQILRKDLCVCQDAK